MGVMMLRVTPNRTLAVVLRVEPGRHSEDLEQKYFVFDVLDGENLMQVVDADGATAIIARNDGRGTDPLAIGRTFRGMSGFCRWLATERKTNNSARDMQAVVDQCIQTEETARVVPHDSRS